MPRYRVLRDFGSHLGNHYQGEHLNLPDGPLPRGFAGFVERVADPVQKDVVPAPDGPASSRSEAGLAPPASPPASPPESDQPSFPSAADEARAGYPDKMLRSRGGRSK